MRNMPTSMPCACARRHACRTCSTFDAALHGVEDFLAAALRADPDAITAELAQQSGGAFVLQTVGARDGFERTVDATALELRGIAGEPGMTDGEDVIGVPHLVGIVTIDDPLHLIGHVGRAAPPMGMSVDGVRAPVAAICAAARGDEVDAAGAVVGLPGIEVQAVIDGLAIGKGQLIDVRDANARGVAHDAAVFIAKRDAVHSVQPMHAVSWQRAQKLGERDFAFARDDDVGAGVEIFSDVVGALGTAEHDRPAMQLRGAQMRSTFPRVMRLV
jgi:hypothetical protein